MKRWNKFVIRFLVTMFTMVMIFPLQVFATSGVKISSNRRTSLDNKQSSDIEVHFLNVGQGDSTLVKCGDHAMLIDAGDNTKGTTIQLYLKKQGVKKLDYLILTHPDADHIGGADVIVTKYEINQVFMSSAKKDTKTYRELIDALKYKSINWSTPAVGNEYRLGDAKFTIIAPVKSYDSSEEASNNSSIGLILQNGANRFLFTGDAEEEAEKDIVSGKIDLLADVYQVGHHGGKTSSGEGLVGAVKPKWAVISCGEDNSYGHPHAETLNRFRSMGIKVFRTDEQGTIVAVSDGKEITWNCAPSESWKAGEPTSSGQTTSKQTTPKQTTPKAIEPQPAAPPVTVPEVTAPAPSAAQAYVCNTNTKKFHYPGCSSVGQMKDKNKLEVTCTREELINQGYDPCGRCNP